MKTTRTSNGWVVFQESIGPSAFAIAFLIGLAGSTGLVQGQGMVTFNNRYLNVPSVYAPVYGLEPNGANIILKGNATTNGGNIVYSGALLAGSGYSAALFGGPQDTTDPNSLVLVATTYFRSGALAGVVLPQSVAVAVPGVPEGSRAALQMRAWDNKNGTVTNWDQVLADSSAARGVSAMFVSEVLTVPPNVPASLYGLQSFSLYLPAGAAEIAAQPHDLTTAPGSNAVFSVTVVTAGTPLSYQWFFNGASISGATESSLTLTNAQYPNVGEYQVVVTTGSSLTLTSHVARLVLQPSIVLLEQTIIEPWGVQAIRMTYDSTPNRAVHVEANNSLAGNTWLEVGSVSSPVIRGYFFDVFSTNQVRVYRLRLD